jgi:hypothetical protein
MVAEQAQRVRFQRGPSVWDADLPASAYTLELPEFCAVDAWPVDGDDIVLRGDVAAGDVPGGLDRLADEVGRRLFDGPGFTIVRGFPVASKGWAVSARTYAWLMSRFGRLIAQNTAGDPLHLVRTRGLGADKQYGSRGSGELVFHTDQAAAPPEMLPEVLGLLCLDRAAEGGRTQLVSGHALLNELLREAPAAVDALSEPIPFGRMPTASRTRPPWSPGRSSGRPADGPGCGTTATSPRSAPSSSVARWLLRWSRPSMRSTSSFRESSSQWTCSSSPAMPSSPTTPS